MFFRLTEGLPVLFGHFAPLLATMPQQLNASYCQQGLLHPCALGDKFSSYQPQAGPGLSTFAVTDALAG